MGPPPPEILRYKNFLYLLVVGYTALLVTALSVGAVNSALNYVFMLVVAASMAARADQCMMSCIMVLLMLGIICAFFDFVNIISILATPYPGAKNFFSTDCPKNVEATLRANSTIYLKDGLVNGTAAYTVPARTKVEIEEHICSAAWVVRNVVVLIGTLLDILASRLAFRMFKTSMELSQEAQNQGPLQQLMTAPRGGFQGDGRSLGVLQVTEQDQGRRRCDKVLGHALKAFSHSKAQVKHCQHDRRYYDLPWQVSLYRDASSS